MLVLEARKIPGPIGTSPGAHFKSKKVGGFLCFVLHTSCFSFPASGAFGGLDVGYLSLLGAKGTGIQFTSPIQFTDSGLPDWNCCAPAVMACLGAWGQESLAGQELKKRNSRTWACRCVFEGFVFGVAKRGKSRGRLRFSSLFFGRGGDETNDSPLCIRPVLEGYPPSNHGS